MAMQNDDLPDGREAAQTSSVSMFRAGIIQPSAAAAGLVTGAPQDDVSILGVPDLEKLQLILDRSLRVHARSHFFVWAQGILQALLPHEIMVCALINAQQKEFSIDVLSSAPLPAGVEELWRRPGGGFVDELARTWKQVGRRPVYHNREPVAGNIDAQLAATFTSAVAGNFVAHGMCGVDGSVNSFFVLIDQQKAVDARGIYLLETLMPFLHATWLRVNLGQPRELRPARGVWAERILTAREIEVIQRVHDGNSNSQIAIMLKISPLTVKNHMQKILRKLNVQNRAQAVAKSLALRILESVRRS
jgi:transcriptional regulator EpsA